MTETVNHVDTDTGRERRGRLLPHEGADYNKFGCDGQGPAAYGRVGICR
jgi:hypothetical protein